MILARVGRDGGVSRYRAVCGTCDCGDAGVGGEEGVSRFGGDSQEVSEMVKLMECLKTVRIW